MRLSLTLLAFLIGCGSGDSNKFDNVIGTLCLFEERLSDLEEVSKLKVDEHRKLKCQNYKPQIYFTPTPLPRH